MNTAARAFEETLGATCDGIHSGQDEFFVGHMVDEAKHPGAESFKRCHCGSESLPGSCQFLDFAMVNGFDKSVSGRKVTVQRA